MNDFLYESEVVFSTPNFTITKADIGCGPEEIYISAHMYPKGTILGVGMKLFVRIKFVQNRKRRLSAYYLSPTAGDILTYQEIVQFLKDIEPHLPLSPVAHPVYVDPLLELEMLANMSD
jgi:hypothetical protein